HAARGGRLPRCGARGSRGDRNAPPTYKPVRREASKAEYSSDLRRQPVAVLERYLDERDVGPPPDLGDEPRARARNGPQQRDRGIERRPDGMGEAVGQGLHLADLVDHDEPDARPGRKRGDRHRVQRRDTDAVAADARPRVGAHAGKDGGVPVERLDGEAVPHAALAELAREESRRHRGREGRDYSLEDGGLADPRWARDEKVGKAVHAHVAPALRHARPAKGPCSTGGPSLTFAFVSPIRDMPRERGIMRAAAKVGWEGVEVQVGPAVAIPLLGTVAAGVPFHAFPVEGTLELPAALWGGRPVFALRARGSSMSDEGIGDGRTLDWTLRVIEQRVGEAEALAAARTQRSGARLRELARNLRALRDCYLETTAPRLRAALLREAGEIIRRLGRFGAERS